MVITGGELGKWQNLANFYAKQLEDRDGIILRSSYTDPDDSEWLVRDIEERLREARKNVQALSEKGAN